MEGVRHVRVFKGIATFLVMLCLKVRTGRFDSRPSGVWVHVGFGWELLLLMARAAAADPQAARATNPHSSGGEGGVTLTRGTPICFWRLGAHLRPFMRTSGTFGAFRGVDSLGTAGSAPWTSAVKVSARGRILVVLSYENKQTRAACPCVKYEMAFGGFDRRVVRRSRG